MNVAVTGHSKGIGLAIFNYFKQKKYNCIGFSRSSGYDISNFEHRNKISENTKNFDIFVNNAYNNFDSSQLELLKLIYDNWIDQDKIIINISSRAPDFLNDVNIYSQTKHELDLYCLGKIRNPWIINLRPGLTDSDRVKNITDKPKMILDHLILNLDFILTNKNKFKITTLTFGL